MTEYRLLQIHSDPVPVDRALPSLVRLTGDSRERAVQEFARQFRLSVDSDDGDTVWFVREKDGVACQYAVTTRAPGAE